MVDVKGFNRAKKKMCVYPDLESARRPVLHCEEVPIVNLNHLHDQSMEFDFLQEDLDTNSGDNNESEYEAFSTIPDQFNQEELNDLIRDLNLSKESSELLASRLNENNCLSPETIPENTVPQNYTNT